MRKFCAIFACMAALTAGCDLQPRILALPDSVGDFISARYPALLADPVAEADIYNSAATDYGVYASPELYGTSTSDDYLLYASVDDYIVPPAAEQNESIAPSDDASPNDTYTNEDNDTSAAASSDDVVAIDVPWATPAATDTTVVAAADTAADNTPPPAQTAPNDVLNVPMYGGRKEILTVIPGDTLYSIARRNGTTVEELASINKLNPPYDLRVGQKLYLVQQPDSVAVPAKPAPAAPAPAAKSAAPAKTQAQSASTPAPAPAPAAKPAGHATTTRVDVTEIVIAPGDTLYSISRAYSVPVNDLAVMNNLSAPFALYAGQKVRVPNLSNAPVRVASVSTPASSSTSAATPAAKSSATPAKTSTATSKTATNTAKAAATTSASNKTDSKSKSAAATTQKKTETKTSTTTATAKPKEKISSDPAKKLPTIAARSSSKFSWPVRGTILSGYGAKASGLFNDGINISASRGTTVKAAENGVVAYAGNEVKGMGNLVIIQHADGWMTVYAHMDSLAVRRGARIIVGQKIGTVGATGKVDKPQLHFEIRKGTKAYNPTQYLKK